jgi:NAD(P)-dependent dehydrogenase (short-subunit alcohol dehydrogenase family)
MKTLLIGASGTIGSAVSAALAAKGHEIVAVTRKTSPAVDITQPASIAALFERVTGIDHVVSCAGGGAWKPLAQLTDEDFARSLGDKLMGQANVIRHALRHVRDGGSITVTAGYLAREPMKGSAAISMINAGLEGFVRAAALEAERGIRVNVVSPPWVTETLVAMKMDTSIGIPAAAVAKAYVAAVEGTQTGATLDPRSLG